MATDLIPKDVEHFILLHIDSVAQLEGLLLLRNHPHLEWCAEKLAERLYIKHTQAGELLGQLYQRGFLVREKWSGRFSYRYKPQCGDLEDLTAQTAELYSRHLVPITNLIHAKPKKRIQEFANAFRLRKD